MSRPRLDACSRWYVGGCIGCVVVSVRPDRGPCVTVCSTLARWPQRRTVPERCWTTWLGSAWAIQCSVRIVLARFAARATQLWALGALSPGPRGVLGLPWAPASVRGRLLPGYRCLAPGSVHVGRPPGATLVALAPAPVRLGRSWWALLRAGNASSRPAPRATRCSRAPDAWGGLARSSCRWSCGVSSYWSCPSGPH